MIRLISKLYSKQRREQWTLDKNIGKIYLIRLAINFAVQCLKGFFYFYKTSHFVKIGRKVEIYDRRRIKFAGNISIGDYSYIDALSLNGIRFGYNVSLGRYTTIVCTGSYTNLGKGFIAGNNVGLGSNCFFGAAGGITIGDDTIFGNYVSLHAENHNFNDTSIPFRLQGVNRVGIIIGKNCWIGAKSTILDGVQIGNNTIVAAGAVVVAGKFPDNVILGGVPAKVIRYLNG